MAGEDLKRDLADLSNEWNRLKEPRKTAWQAKYGHGPPARADCLAFILRKKVWPKWKPGKKTKGTKRIPEEQARLLERVKRFAKSPADQSARQFPFDDSKVDFMVKTSEVSVDDPCPCGSGKQLKDCHLPEIRKDEERARGTPKESG